ncbi:TPA: AP2 domain-containing protein [Bacillus toyonensis]
MGRKNTSSKYKGVSWNKKCKKWKSTITSKGKMIHLGLYENEDDAALAYNKAAIEIFGEHAYQNVIGKNNSVTAVNLLRRQKRRIRSGFRGVRRWNKKYQAVIFYDKKQIHLGMFNTPEEAAKAYDKKAIELFGDKAVLNFPEEVS